MIRAGRTQFDLALPLCAQMRPGNDARQIIFQSGNPFGKQLEWSPVWPSTLKCRSSVDKRILASIFSAAHSKQPAGAFDKREPACYFIVLDFLSPIFKGKQPCPRLPQSLLSSPRS
jgi:hypothetical protein